jgi:hypothetical protein
MVWLVFLLPALAMTRQVVPTTITDEEFQKFFGDLTPFSQNTELFHDPLRGFGFVLTKDVVIGDEVLRVNSSLIISPNEYFYLSPYIQHLKPKDRLIARVLYEKFMGKPVTVKTACIHALSTEAPSSALFWTQADFKLISEVALQNLKKSYFLGSFRDSKQKLIDALGDVQELPSEMLEDDAIKWAYFHTVSRVFGVKEIELDQWFHNVSPSSAVSAETESKFLVPVIDMSNHLPRPYADQLSDEYFYAVQYPTKYGDDYILRADRNQTAGEEYVWSYGLKNNLQLMDTYSFVLENNLNDYLSLSYQHTDYCFEEDKDDWCSYKINRKQLSNNVFRHLYQAHLSKPAPKVLLHKLESTFATADYSTQEVILQVMREYRSEILSRFDEKKGLREVRRLSRSQESYTEYMIYTLAVESRRTAYIHLMLLDKLYIRLVGVIYP